MLRRGNKHRVVHTPKREEKGGEIFPFPPSKRIRKGTRIKSRGRDGADLHQGICTPLSTSVVTPDGTPFLPLPTPNCARGARTNLQNRKKMKVVRIIQVRIVYV